MKWRSRRSECYSRSDLQLLDAVTDGNKLVVAPEQSVHLDGEHVLGKLIHVGFIIPRLI